MKITSPFGASRAKATGGVRSRDSSGAATAPEEAGGGLEIAGVPAAELTPRVRRALATLMGEVQALRAEIQSMRGHISELEQLADKDPLVGALNRRAFVREIYKALALADRYNAPSSLVFADVDNLKIINDELGHAAGDAALVHVAAVLTKNLRRTDSVGRLGGDEFGVLLTQTDHQTADQKAVSLADLVSADPVDWPASPFRAKVSCGVVEITKCSTAEAALEMADAAMYEVKKSRRKAAE